MERFEGVDISLMTPDRLMAMYQENSVDFKFEKTIRMDEIKQFAANVVPKPRFIFDNYRFNEGDGRYAADNSDEKDLSSEEIEQREE